MSLSRYIQLHASPFSGTSVVYVMSRDQRVHDNHALLYAQQLALKHRVPLYVLFVCTFLPNRSREHYAFMLKGLEEVADSLTSLHIGFAARTGKWQEEVLRFSAEADAGALVFDFSPLRGPRRNLQTVAKQFSGEVTVVDTHNIIPVWITSDKQEFAAHTIRRKIHRHLAEYLHEPDVPQDHPHTAPSRHSLTFEQLYDFIEQVPASHSRIEFEAGEHAARKQLDEFLADDIENYAQLRNDFSVDHQSNLSPYLHFGQIASLRVVLECIRTVDTPPLLLRQAKMPQPSGTPSLQDGMDALLEELIVRKELSDNFCFYNPHYTTLLGAPDWARNTLANHADDPRDALYTKEQWEQAATHDNAWNAAQIQLMRTGKLHGYLRMYWAKKLLEWSVSPDDALATGIYLNDKYSIDGGDPNGYVGLLWAIAGLHDRPWSERPVYGMVRYMNAAGLKRKYDLDTYIRTWQP